MKDKLLYVLLYGWVRLTALLPFPLLYLFSDGLYLLAYHLVRYRRKVVRRNLAASFPEKAAKERRQLERAFYRHLADYFTETVKLAQLPMREVQRRACLQNPELIDRLMDEGHPCVLMLMGHYGNWEWFSSASSFFRDAHIYQIYRPLKSKAFDRLFIRLRTRFGARLIKKNDTLRDVIRLSRSGERCVVIFLADQTPSRANLHYWTEFLHQDTPMLTGPERIARKLDIPVVFLDVERKTRGFYSVNFELISATPKQMPENAITEQYARLMEQSISRAPAYWLWSHKRWKYKREDAI
ncbi:MAG: lysophospholipid acyltransferase family protein [Tannerella sp.]|jgi:KDO2-lipid IV(A) lauroyltransferase|nr:lysophospholipid acyltransferase family protein [Tannerella sp.]